VIRERQDAEAILVPLPVWPIAVGLRFPGEVIQSHDYDGKAKLREAAVAFMGRFQLHFSKVSPIVGNSLLRVAFPWEPRNPAGFDVSSAWASVLR